MKRRCFQNVIQKAPQRNILNFTAAGIFVTHVALPLRSNILNLNSLLTQQELKNMHWLTSARRMSENAFEITVF